MMLTCICFKEECVSVGKGTVMRLCGKQAQVKWLSHDIAVLSPGQEAKQAALVGTICLRLCAKECWSGWWSHHNNKSTEPPKSIGTAQRSEEPAFLAGGVLSTGSDKGGKQVGLKQRGSEGPWGNWENTLKGSLLLHSWCKSWKSYILIWCNINI